jgi:hypothetical protein
VLESRLTQSPFPQVSRSSLIVNAQLISSVAGKQPRMRPSVSELLV